MTRTIALALLAPLVSLGATGSARRLKDLVGIEGVRDNQLIGYGVVVGLNQTGDRRQTVFSVQTLTNLLQQMGVQVSPANIRVSNTASVMVTATLPPFAQPGMRLDVQVAAIGDASNLQGGLLVITSLRGLDGQSYAVAQGNVVTGGFVAGGGGNKQTLNHPTAGRIPAGATVEKAPPSIMPSQVVKLQLRNPDFTTAVRIAKALNDQFALKGDDAARADNSALVMVNLPPSYRADASRFVAELEAVRVEVDMRARVVINERTGTIVMGKEVKVAPVAILQGNLTVQIETRFDVSQPPAASFGVSQGQTVVVPQENVAVKEEKARNITLKEGSSVEELVRAMVTIGSTPRDIISILQNLRSAGALDAEIEVI